MVHALEKVARLLRPDGILIDIHPSQQPPQIEVNTAEERFAAGTLQESDDFVEYEQADRALAQVQSQGLFSLEAVNSFIFTIHAPSLDELRNFLAENWKDAILPQESVAMIDTVFAEHPMQDLKITISEQIKIGRLKRS